MTETVTTENAAPPTLLRALHRQLAGDLQDAERREHVGRLAEVIRESSGDAARQLDELWLSTVTRQQAGLQEAARHQEAIRELLETLTAPPLHVGTFLGTASHAGVPTAMVSHEGVTLIVGLGEGVEPSGLRVGQEVLLTQDRTVLLGASPYGTTHCGETATFSRVHSDDRLVLRWRDEEVLVRGGADLDPNALRDGDSVLWDSRLQMAFEKVERSTESSFFLEHTPLQTFDDVGGLDVQIESLQQSIRLHYENPELCASYGLHPNRSTLFVGPPGTGKTLLARALANWVATLAPSGQSRFMNIKPASLHSSWYAQSEANYREAFRVAREVGKAEPDVPVVMFFDEVDSVGAARTPAGQHVDDRVLTALMAELDGLEARGNILVVAATNRRTALDPALLRPGRLGDLVLEVPRPDRAAAVHILERHLGPDVPFHAGDEGGSEAARAEAIQVAASRMYAPNAEADLATLTLRDGTRRTVTASDLVSGAVLENVARSAIQRACVREAGGGEPGVTQADLLEAISDGFETAASALTPFNAARFLGGLPQDVDVVRVERVESPTGRTHRYLEVA